MGLVNDELSCQTLPVARHVPLVRNVMIRTGIGYTLLTLSMLAVCKHFDRGHVGVLVLVATVAWSVSVFITHKYVHKYPQRYSSYLVASHLKAAAVMASALWVLAGQFPSVAVPIDVLWSFFFVFSIADFLVSMPRTSDCLAGQSLAADVSAGTPGRLATSSAEPVQPAESLTPIDTKAVVDRVRSTLDPSLASFVETSLPTFEGELRVVLAVDDVTGMEWHDQPGQAAMLVGRIRVNDVRRLNRYLMRCINRIAMGGFLVIRYTPLEFVVSDLKRRYKGVWYWPVVVFHFLWYRAIPKTPWLDLVYFSPYFAWLDSVYYSRAKKRNRALSKAEMWGRLCYFGMDVLAESESGMRGERFVIARRVAGPVKNRRPSYYPVVALEKVSIDGNPIRMHKIRTMYPFSEFLQKRIVQDHGLSSMGKIKDDFRLTELGKYLRRYWLDEVPQIFDWLRGDVKLVGMRATSSHFLGLYPKELYDLYVQIKPGLIPPIFSESTGGFDEIVRIELTYLQRYLKQPFFTDVRYLFETFSNIVLRGVRSK